jgi:hypothetical protein
MVKGETSDGEPIRRAFWMETGVTGASETAADLPKTSVGGTGGQPQLLLGMATPDEHREYILPLREPGEAPKPTVVKYWGGGRNNGMWRWQQLPSDVTNALVFLLEDAGGGLEYRVLEPSTIPLLQAVSRADKNIGGKRWGTIQLSQIEQTRCSELVRQTWRHELLPQLIDNLEAQGAELLLDPARRAEWFEGQPDLDQPGAEAGLKALDLLLVQLGLGITVKGTGVGRAPFIEELAAQPAEPAVIPEAGADA